MRQPAPCRRPPVEGEVVTLRADLTVLPASSGVVKSVSWQVTGVAGTPSGTMIVLTLPTAGQTVHVQVSVALSDNSTTTGAVDITPLTANAAERIVKLYQLRYIFSYMPLQTIPFGPATDPLGIPELIRGLERAMKPERIALMLEAGLKSLRGR